MPRRSPQQQLENLRAHRVRPAPDTSMNALFGAERRTVQRAHKRLGAIAEAWNTACPSDLLDRTALLSLARGVLTVAVPDASAMYDLDRALRSGLERQIVSLSRAPVRKIKVLVQCRP